MNCDESELIVTKMQHNLRFYR